MDWYVVDKKYMSYLTQFDSRIGYVEYGERLKLHVGILLIIENFRSFSNEKEKTDYIYLLQKEKALIDHVQDTLQNKAMKLYQKCITKPDSSLAARCCNFKVLEEKCSSYIDT